MVGSYSIGSYSIWMPPLPNLHSISLLSVSNAVAGGCQLLQVAAKQAREGVDADKSKATFDSNCITPGTPFMARLAAHLRYFFRKKISEDPAWQRPLVVFSGAKATHPAGRLGIAFTVQATNFQPVI